MDLVSEPVAFGKEKEFPQGKVGPAWPWNCPDLVALLPRDLKRDVSKKLEKLEKRTQRAIAELIRAFQSRGNGGGSFQRDPCRELAGPGRDWWSLIPSQKDLGSC